jgi:hypothetical protein
MADTFFKLPPARRTGERRLWVDLSHWALMIHTQRKLSWICKSQQPLDASIALGKAGPET